MRIWSLHPHYLDTKGLVALWRETLLAKKVLEGNTRGYKNHPQLLRFQQAFDPLLFINTYLYFVLEEARTRGYTFNREKVDWEKCRIFDCYLEVTKGQLDFERDHLLSKLLLRDPVQYETLIASSNCEPHPLFITVHGAVEDWEKPKQRQN